MSEFHKAALPFLCQIPLLAGERDLFDVYSFAPSKGRNCWHLSDDMGEEFRQSHTAYLKQNYSQLANPPLEKQSILMKQCFKIQKLEARAEFLRFYT